MVPTKRITNPSFAYVPSYATDIRQRFEKERERLAQQENRRFDNENMPERK